MDPSDRLVARYRPSGWNEVVEQRVVVETLTQMIRTNRVHPVHVFHGPRGTGKTTCARLLVAALNCESSSGDVCGACPSCSRLREGRSMAVVEMDAASHGLVDDVRRIQEEVTYLTTEKYRVYVLDECHSMSGKAWEAFLKLLEEPPPRIVFVFCTTEVSKVPSTIMSRAFDFEFRKVTHEGLVRMLSDVAQHESISVSEEVLSAVAQYADGGARDALSLLDQLRVLRPKAGPISIELFDRLTGRLSFEQVVVTAEAIVKGDLKAVYQGIDRAKETLSDLSVFVLQLVEVFEAVLRTAIGVRSEITEERRQRLAVLASQPIDRLVEIHGRLVPLADRVHRTVLPSGPVLEVGLTALVELPPRSAIVAPEAPKPAPVASQPSPSTRYLTVDELASRLGASVVG